MKKGRVSFEGGGNIAINVPPHAYDGTVGFYRDDIEELPGDLKGFWIASPSNIIHLVCKKDGI